jgi:CheY-like chemotaxis protein
MGGDITVKSEYGQGSVFTALIPQLVKDDTPLARVEHPETKTILIYENRALYVESIVYTINNLGLSCTVARTRNDFVEQLAGDAGRSVRQFIFSSPALFDEVREILQNRDTASGVRTPDVPAGPVLVLLLEYGQAAYRDIHTVFMPLQPVAVANILNNQESDMGYQETESLGVRFTAPDARVLIVDDIETNLNVAEGLLSPYKMSIDCAEKGLEAVRLVRENRYDLVLMDHMMPGMDGIEAAAAIHAWEESHNEKKVPIIALTANAISGMKEMFLEKGFSDYISKPIEIAKLDEIVSRWIPAEKRIKAGAGIRRETLSGKTEIVIPGVDTQKGIAMTGGTEAKYRKVLAQFYKDAVKRLPVFADPPTETALVTFVIQAHAIKGAAGTIGAAEVSKEAAVLETAGKAGDTKTIGETLPGFHKGLTQLIEGIGKALEGSEELGGRSKGKDVSLTALPALRAALEAKNMKEIDRLLEKIEQLPLGVETRERINTISDKVLMGEYQGAVEIINLLLTAKEQ